MVLDEEANWRARGTAGGMLDRGGARGGGGGEYVSDLFVEPADVEGFAGEAGGGGEDARAAREA